MSKCPDTSSLEAFARDELEPEAALAIELHVEECTRCAKRLACTAIGDDLLAEIEELEKSNIEIAEAMQEMRRRHPQMSSTVFGQRNP